jgi:uncharacterized membrane protein YesL
MRRIPHTVYSTTFGVVYLALMTNLLLVVACLPLVVLLVTTDPAHSWPLLAIAAALAAPALTAAFTVFREHQRGGLSVIRAFVSGIRSTWRKALSIGALAGGLLVVLLVDVRAVAASTIGVVAVPILLLLSVTVVGVGLVSLVALAEVPSARLRDVLRASLYLAVRRGHLTAISLAVLTMQAVAFTAAPALALGLTAAPALYLVWANSRYSLRPVLENEEASAA